MVVIGYFEVRALAPLVVCFAYPFLRFPRWASYLMTSAFLGVAVALGIMWVSGVPLFNVVRARLSYDSAVEAMLFGAAATWLLRRDPARAALICVLGISAIGWLYEVAFEHSPLMFYGPPCLAFPLIINTQIISLVVLVAMLLRRGWRGGTLFSISSILYAVLFMYLAVNITGGSNAYMSYNWLIRLPSYAMLLSAIHEAEGVKP
jgi:hypothetical protein